MSIKIVCRHLAKTLQKFSCYSSGSEGILWVQIKKERLSKIPENRSVWILSMRRSSTEDALAYLWASSYAYQEGLRQRRFTSYCAMYPFGSLKMSVDFSSELCFLFVSLSVFIFFYSKIIIDSQEFAKIIHKIC